MSFIPAPPSPTSTPTPTPLPTYPAIFSNVTTSQDFATLGYESPGHPIQPASLVDTGFLVSYDSPTNSYYIDVPATETGLFQVTSTGERYWNSSLAAPNGHGTLPISLNVFRPGPQNSDFPNLTYTTFAEYSSVSGHFGDVAFGQATPGSDVPLVGSATYTAFAAGYMDDRSIRGSAILQFNFGAGTLAGSFDPYIYDALAGNSPLGHYTFTNTVFGLGSTTFSGELSTAGTAARGSFNGQFTGPHAQELLSRWTAPLHNPVTGQDSQMFGVWVGRSQ